MQTAMDGTITITINLYWLVPIIIIFVFVDRYLRCKPVENVSDKYILITGCDTGFGQRAALLFAKKCHVIAGCLTNEGCQRLRQESLANLIPIQMDVRGVTSIQDAYVQVEKIVPEAEGLVHF